jgi:capsular polysaccharide biosynthesis protein
MSPRAQIGWFLAACVIVGALGAYLFDRLAG